MRLVVAFLMSVVTVEGGCRVKRWGRSSSESISENCRQVTREFKQCSRTAYFTYEDVIKKGEDGRPNFLGRKSCKYLQEAVDTCGTVLSEGDCYSQEKIAEALDYQIRSILCNIQFKVKEWDSSRCPAIKKNIERLEKVELTEEEEDDDDDDESEELEDESGGSLLQSTNWISFFSLVVPIILSMLFPMFSRNV